MDALTRSAAATGLADRFMWDVLHEAYGEERRAVQAPLALWLYAHALRRGHPSAVTDFVAHPERLQTMYWLDGGGDTGVLDRTPPNVTDDDYEDDDPCAALAGLLSFARFGWSVPCEHDPSVQCVHVAVCVSKADAVERYIVAQPKYFLLDQPGTPMLDGESVDVMVHNHSDMETVDVFQILQFITTPTEIPPGERITLADRLSASSVAATNGAHYRVQHVGLSTTFHLFSPDEATDDKKQNWIRKRVAELLDNHASRQRIWKGGQPDPLLEGQRHRLGLPERQKLRMPVQPGCSVVPVTFLTLRSGKPLRASTTRTVNL